MKKNVCEAMKDACDLSWLMLGCKAHYRICMEIIESWGIR